MSPPTVPAYRLITFLTDYQTSDAYVAICHGVLDRFAAGVPVLDITHSVPRQDIRHGATVLAAAVPWLPPAVHLAVVDPGVGTARRPVVITAGPSVLVGPDNGLLVPAAEALGGVDRAFVLTDHAAFLYPVSATFHGRDVFAPVAGRIAAGQTPADLGTGIDAEQLVRLAEPVSAVEPGAIRAEVVYVDTYGNVRLSAAPEDLRTAGLADAAAIAIATADRVHRARPAATFADVATGELVVYRDSAGHLEIAANRARAAELLGVVTGGRVELRAAR